ncbi:MAG: carbohydrate ABC transporter permease [Chloroflexi bacterium]|nr:carbohydrate ABC transporter permease [Chloroflexota bacterium]
MNTTSIKPRRIRQSWHRPQIVTHLVIIFLILLSLVPIYLMLTIAMKTSLQYQHERWIISFPLRFSNYSAAWDILGRYILNTIAVGVIGFGGVLVLSVIGGYVFARMRFPFREQLYIAIIALLMVPWVISFVPAYMLYNSFKFVINTWWAMIIPNVAAGPVFGIFLLRTFFAGIPEELYESARIDGAGHGALIWNITLPLSLPIIATLAILNFLGTWNNFLWPMITINDQTKQMISVGLYLISGVSGGAGSMEWGPLFAGYVLSAVPLVILFFALGKFYVEGLIESGLKV